MVVILRTYICVAYTLSKSLPLKCALTKVGPRVGTKYNVAMKVNIENPIDVYRAGKEGIGSRNGRTMNQEAIGTKASNRVEDIGRGGG